MLAINVGDLAEPGSEYGPHLLRDCPVGEDRWRSVTKPGKVPLHKPALPLAPPRVSDLRERLAAARALLDSVMSDLDRLEEGR
jgi:hypothetical protein